MHHVVLKMKLHINLHTNMFLFDECVDFGINEFLFKLYVKNNLLTELKQYSFDNRANYFEYYIKGADDRGVLDFTFVKK